MNYYGEDADYIHLKFGDMRKMYHFTDEFRSKHPTFCAEYKKYWDRDPKCKFEDPMMIANYVEMWGVPVHFYFNYTDKPAKNIHEVRAYLINERVPHDMGVFKDDKMTGWDGEEEVQPDLTKLNIIINGKAHTFKDGKELKECIEREQSKKEIENA